MRALLLSLANMIVAHVERADERAATTPQPDIEPEEIPGDWNDAVGDYDPDTQEVDLRVCRFDGRDIQIVVPSFDPFAPEITDLYALVSAS